MHSVRVAEPDVTANNIKILTVEQQMLLWQIYVAGNNTIYLDLRPRFPHIFA